MVQEPLFCIWVSSTGHRRKRKWEQPQCCSQWCCSKPWGGEKKKKKKNSGCEQLLDQMKWKTCGVNMKFELVGKNSAIRNMLKSSYHVNALSRKNGHGNNDCTYTALSSFQKLWQRRWTIFTRLAESSSCGQLFVLFYTRLSLPVWSRKPASSSSRRKDAISWMDLYIVIKINHPPFPHTPRQPSRNNFLLNTFCKWQSRNYLESV